MKSLGFAILISLVSATAGAATHYEGRITEIRSCVGDLRKGNEQGGALTCEQGALPANRKCLLSVEGDLKAIRVHAPEEIGYFPMRDRSYHHWLFSNRRTNEKDGVFIKLKVRPGSDKIPSQFEARFNYEVSKRDYRDYSFDGIVCSNLKRIR